MLHSEKNIKLIEVCDTWQGEGPNTGKQMLLVRFKECNRKCPFCDTSVRMKTAHSGFYSIDDINAALSRSKSLMITGGEPTFSPNYEQTKLMLFNTNYEIANVETNGFNLIQLVNDYNSVKILPEFENKIINFIWSPKFFDDSDFHEAVKILHQIYNEYNVYVKIVVVSNLLERIEKFLEYSSTRISSKNRIYLMVQGTTKEEINKNWDNCIELADKYNCNISSRMHIVHGFI